MSSSAGQLSPNCCSIEVHSTFFELEASDSPGGDGSRRAVDLRIRESLYAKLTTASAQQNLQIAALLHITFQEILRRYLGQSASTAGFRTADSLVFDVALDSNASVRQGVLAVDRAVQKQCLIQSQGAVHDGEFLFLPNFSLAVSTVRETSSPICLVLGEDGPTLRGFFEYDCKIFPPFVVESMVAHFECLLDAALDNPDNPMADLEMLADSEVQTLLAWNRTDREYPRLRADDLFFLRVGEAPDATAVICGEQTLTYRMLADEVNRLAVLLRELGVGPEVLVGISMDRCSEMVTALLAIFAAGGAYLPLDPTLPAARIAFLLEDARPSLVITQTRVSQKVSFGAIPVLCLDSTALPGAVAAPAKESAGSELDNLAYVLYTSGSTGRPKGVEITHRALTNLLIATSLEVSLRRDDVFIAATTLSFDISAFEIFGPLIAGACVVIVPHAVAAEGELLASAIRKNGATFLQATPSGWRVLLESGWTGQPGLKIATGGEPLDRRLAQQLLQRGAGVWNFYGPTETTVSATVRRLALNDTEITVGRPLANYKTYILDDRNKRLPAGAIGELWIGGVGVGRGYRNRPEMTAARFLPDAFSNESGCRMYRTGDLARFTPDGEIQLLGRADTQVKLRGHRIELEEIEAFLDAHQAIRKSLVKVLTDESCNQRLIAYFVKSASHSTDRMQLRDLSRRSLPSYMVPADFIEIEEIPLTPSGKIDRKSPLYPKGQKFGGDDVGRAAPQDDLERAMLECWRSALQAPDLNPDDNFFDRGGHSLLAARLFTQIHATLRKKLPLGLLIEAPTVRLLAQRVRQMDSAVEYLLVPMQTGGSLPPLYLVHHLFGDVLLYRALADCFAGERPVFGIQAPTAVTQKSELRSCESLAALYVKDILQRQPTGPYHLVGFSSGGVIAFEMAQQLNRLGHEVGILALLDAEIDAPGPALPLIEKYRKLAFRKICKVVFKFDYELRQGPKEIVMKRLKSIWLGRKIRHLERLPKSKDRMDLTMAEALRIAERAYRPQKYAGPALLIRFHDEARKFGLDPTMGWGGLIPAGLQIADLPGNHISGLAFPKVAGLAELLSAGMKNSVANSGRFTPEAQAATCSVDFPNPLSKPVW